MARASLAERFAFGTPLREVPVAPVGVIPRSLTILIARALISVIFLVSGYAKLSDPATSVGFMEQVGLPASYALVYLAGLAEVLGGVAILFGFLGRLGGIGLVAYLVITTLSFHAFWSYAGEARYQQQIQFMKNLAIIGGLLLVFAVGPGRLSIDARLRRPLSP